MSLVVAPRALSSSLRWGFLLAIVVAASMTWSPRVSAGRDSVDSLSRTLATDRSYRVRIQAAEVLGKLKDPRGVPALARALKDQNQTVRAVAVDALASIGGDAARAALKTVRADDAPLVRTRLKTALARLEAAATLASRSAGIPYVEIGGIGSKAKVSPVLVERLREFVARELERTPGIKFSRSPAAASARPAGEGYFVDSSITVMNKRPVGSLVEISCEVSYVVGRLPSKSMAMMTSGGASVQVPRSLLKPDRELAAQSDVLESAVHGAHANLLAYLKTTLQR